MWVFPVIPPNQKAIVEMVGTLNGDAKETIVDVTVTADNGVERSIPVKGSLKEEKPAKDLSLENFNWSIPFQTPDQLQGIWQATGEMVSGDQAKNYVPLGLIISRDTIFARDTPVSLQPELASETDKFIQGRWHIVPQSDDPNSLRGTFEWICTDEPYNLADNLDRPLKRDADGSVLPEQLMKRKRRLRGTYKFQDNRLTLEIQEANEPPDFLGKLPATWTFQGPPVQLPSPSVIAPSPSEN